MNEIPQIRDFAGSDPLSALADASPAMSDPSEQMEFSRPPFQGVRRFDFRSNDELVEELRTNVSPLERERAAWEYADRGGFDALPILTKFARNDPDPEVRSSALWILQKKGQHQTHEILTSGLSDDDPEVRDWARLLLRELTGIGRFVQERNAIAVDRSNPFDQTLPLKIAGYARVLAPGMGWFQATLSPKWFEAIMGRVMACTRADTFQSDLVIEKRIADFYGESSPHYDTFLFRGLTTELAPDVYYHQYEGRSTQPFYPSGKVASPHVPPVTTAGVLVQRVAMTVRIPNELDETRPLVQSVRGKYTGFAYTDIPRVLESGMRVGAGEVQLVGPADAAVGKFANTFLYGTFKGKLSDLNGDGALDVNTERCHATLDGQLDTDLDGVPDLHNARAP